MAIIDTQAEQHDGFDARAFKRVALAGFALLAIAGGLLWLRFGSSIYFDTLAALQGCF